MFVPSVVGITIPSGTFEYRFESTQSDILSRMNNCHLPAVGMLEHMVTASDPPEHKTFFLQPFDDLSTMQLYTRVHIGENSPLKG